MSSVERPTEVDHRLGRWATLAVAALVIIVAVPPLAWWRDRSPEPVRSAPPAPTFVGDATCRDCHQPEWQAWLGSDHDLAMDVATEQTVKGDFNDVEVSFDGVTCRFFRRDGGYFVFTEGAGGEMREFQITHTFGHEPLQQFLVPFPGGRMQALGLAWDVERQEWFDLYPDADIPPDDWLHWTRNGQNWNGMCAECHSTNLIKGYHPESQSYTTTWTDIDVGCEACHGPGSEHVAWAEMEPMARPELPGYGLAVVTRDQPAHAQVELCAPCHSRRAELGDYDHTEAAMLDRFVPALLQEGLYWPDGQILDEVYVYGSFVQSKMYAREIRCGDCHNVHSGKLRFAGNALCAQCHPPDAYDSREHHFHKKEVDGHPSDGALCVKCHMPERPYMVIDWRADHSLRVPRPDLSLALWTPNACSQAGCHGDKPLQWVVDAYRRWYGQARKPHFGSIFAAGRAGDPAAVVSLDRIARDTLSTPIVRATALSLLARYPGQTTRRTLQDLLAADDPLIAPLLSDPVRGVRIAAASLLAGVPAELLKPYQREAMAAAATELRAAMERSLDFASAGHNLGNYYAALGQVDEAERYYRLALDIDALFFPARENLAILLASAGRLADAEAVLRDGLALEPDRLEAAYSLALLLVEEGKRGEAVGWMRKAAAGISARPRVHYNFGLLLQSQGALDEAETELRRAVAAEPENLDFLYALAHHLLGKGDNEEALAVARRIIATHPDERLGYDLEAAATQRPESRSGD